MEANVEHYSATSTRAPDSATLLEAAGALCALQLFADTSGFTTAHDTNAGFVAIREIPCLRSLPVALALKTKLFVGVGEGKFAAVHRSVSEYLAARYLARVLEDGGVPIGRVLSLMSAADGGIVAGLRGLHAWLAVHDPRSRSRLADIDPLGVVLYGDVKLFSVDDKLTILKALHHLARHHAGFRWQDWSAKPFGALATPDMVSHLRSVLVSPSREEGDQAFLDCVLDAVRYGDPLPEIKSEIRAAALDATRWPAIRHDALKAYIHVSGVDSDDLRCIAQDIQDGKIADPNDELLGQLLHELFPKKITANEVFVYLHRPKDDALIGTYYMFWARGLADRASDSDMPVLLDRLAEADLNTFEGRSDIRLRDMIGALLTRGVRAHGEVVDDERLYRWLGVAVDKHGGPRIESGESTFVKTWLESHPERYKRLLSCGIANFSGSTNLRWQLCLATARLQGANAPSDIGLWWLERAEQEPDQVRSEIYFFEAVGRFFSGQGDSRLSIEFFEKWVAERPRFAKAYQGVTYEEIPDWRLEDARRDRERELEERKRRAEWVEHFRSHLPEIRAGRAHPGILHDLAQAYFGHLMDARGDNELDRLSDLLDGDEELVSAALAGFRKSLDRPDLPSVAEIIELGTQGRMHFIRQPCLAGLAELHRENAAAIYGLSDNVLRQALAFHYTYALGNDPEWFKDLVLNKPALVAEVFVQYATAMLKTKKDHVSGLNALAYDASYAAVARIAITPLLRAIPERVPAKQVPGALGDLLKAALRYLDDENLKRIVKEKLELPRLDPRQRVYWLAAGLAIAPREFESILSSFVGKCWARIRGLSAFFSDRFDRWVVREGMREASLANLIRMLASVCSPERPRGAHWVSPAMQTAEFVHALINRLGGSPTHAASAEIKALLEDASLAAWRGNLRHAHYTQRISYREATFRHPTVLEVCQTLEDRAPANAADLAALTIEFLRELALEIRHGNTDQYKQFWNVDSYSRPENPRPEDACRDTLLERLRERLRKLGVDAQPEGHYADDKRADIRVSYAAPSVSMAIPIEIKRDSHPDLWGAMADQLVKLYTRAPESAGRGIFLAFWFGGQGMPPPPNGARVTSALELESNLLAMCSDDKKEVISVCVIDCSPSAEKVGGRRGLAK